MQSCCDINFFNNFDGACYKDVKAGCCAAWQLSQGGDRREAIFFLDELTANISGAYHTVIKSLCKIATIRSKILQGENPIELKIANGFVVLEIKENKNSLNPVSSLCRMAKTEMECTQSDVVTIKYLEAAHYLLNQHRLAQSVRMIVAAFRDRKSINLKEEGKVIADRIELYCRVGELFRRIGAFENCLHSLERARKELESLVDSPLYKAIESVIERLEGRVFPLKP